MTEAALDVPHVEQGVAFEISEAPQTLGLLRRVKNWLDLRRERPRAAGFHPSEMERMCPVLTHFLDRANDDLCSGDSGRIERAFAFRAAVLEAKRFHAGLKMEFGVGDAIHEQVQFYLGVLGYLWGVWHCPFCGSRTQEGFMPRTLTRDTRGDLMHDAAPCQECKGRNYRFDYPWLYVEPSMGDTALAQELGIAGNMDGDLRFQREGRWFRYVLEVKSINSAGFTLKRGPLPKPEHIAQASLYAWLKGIQWLHFIYVNKDQVSEWKEIVVPVDQSTITAARGKIDAVLQARATGAPPLHARVCGDPRDERARTCPAVGLCFGQRANGGFVVSVRR